MTSAEIRQQFIDFFVKKHGHRFVPSSPVVPQDDPTLLFTNAGMNQFKPIFLGLEKRDYTRAANTQKCIRAGGKHNDLDDVGRSRRHHTFFEMLGNWSFGDYFKREAIAWSWELLTKVWKLDPTRLHVTVHAGDAAIGVPRDDEAANLWREVAGVPDDHIHYGNTKDNFWEMGETGPCGPCTEIFVDRTPDKTGGPTVLSGEDPRVMEIWNNVFIQYNRNADRSLTPLPAQHVDTGMGLERIIQVLQGKDDNYGIDLFDPFWAKLKELSGITYGGKYPKGNSADPEAEARDTQLRHDIAFRVIADHARCLTFALTDGAVPSNEGRGYVLRRILRRAVFWGRKHLAIEQPFLYTLVPVVVDAMGDAFPELRRDPQRVVDIVKDEEISFGKTLDRGIELFDGVAKGVELYASGKFVTGESPLESGAVLEGRHIHSKELEIYKAAGRMVLPGEAAFKLHDTYGFPVDLTRIMAEERGLTVDLSQYEKIMEQAREQARAANKRATTEVLDWRNTPPTLDAPKYATRKIDAVLAAFVQRVVADDERSPLSISTAGHRIREGESAALVLNRTCFYAEQGGQVGDVGSITYFDGSRKARFDVKSTTRSGDFVLHEGVMAEGWLTIDDRVQLEVSHGYRTAVEKNHTATHVANWALREVLGEGVQQKGSLVDPEKLRFDFSHDKAIADDELSRIETIANETIAKDLKVYAQQAPQGEALKINGLRAVFGEKYPPMVRVVSIGVPVEDLISNPASADWRQYSVEFCGGTHLGSTKEIDGFVVTAEESVSKGIRRIVAFTGDAAKQALAESAKSTGLLERAHSVQGAEIAPLLAEFQGLANGAAALRTRRAARAGASELQAKQKAFEKSQKQSSAGGAKDVAAVVIKMLESATPIGGSGKLVIGDIPGAGNDELLAAYDSIKKRSPSFALMLGSASDGKVNFVAAVSDDLIKQGLKAGDWIREVAKVAGGGGGGRPQLAQAGGKDPSKLPDAFARARDFAQDAIK